MTISWLAWTLPITAWTLVASGVALTFDVDGVKKFFEMKLGPVSVGRAVGVLALLTAAAMFW